MSDAIETVKIKRGDRVTRINKCDFDPKIHVLADAPQKTAAKAAPSRPADDERPALREEYERVFGKKPFAGWDADKLREKIAAA